MDLATYIAFLIISIITLWWGYISEPYYTQDFTQPHKGIPVKTVPVDTRHVKIIYEDGTEITIKVVLLTRRHYIAWAVIMIAMTIIISIFIIMNL